MGIDILESSTYFISENALWLSVVGWEEMM